LKYYPSLYVINDDKAPDTNLTGTVYQWDKYEFPDNETFADWLLNKTYLNSSISFHVPRLVYDNEMKFFYVKRWFKNNFGGRFCSLCGKVPGMTTAMGMFCDYDRTDFGKKKEDRFTMIVAPFVLVYFGIPYAFYLLRWFIRIIFECCAWNVYIDEEDL
jgi:hypothetical protein